MRRLTPPGGARELLPAEYAYTLPRRRAAARSRRGRYAFRAVARVAARRRRRRRALGAVRAMRTVTLYGRPGCHLCDDARARSSASAPTRPFRLEEVDIESDDALFTRYLERIPVVALDGEELFELFVDEQALEAKAHS